MSLPREQMTIDPVMKKVIKIFQASGKTYHEIGVLMGYQENSARVSAHKFLRTTYDPQISVLRRFSRAVQIPLSQLVKT